MTDVRLSEFAQFLAGIKDPHEVEAMVARAKMLAMNSADPELFEADIKTLRTYLATPIPVPPILVEPALVVRGGITCTIGRAGKGKTQVNLNRILKWACGRPLFDGLMTPDGQTPILAPSAPLKILVIENEGAAGMFHKQVGIMTHAPGYLSDEDRELVLENVLIWGDGGYSGLKLDDEAQLNTVKAGCEKWKPDIVFIEPFRGLWQGDENSSTDMAKVADALSDIAATYECGVILTHHERKSGAGDDGEKMSAGRGSTVLEGVVATMENFEIAKGGDYREWSVSKLRYGGGVKVLPVRMEWQSGDWWYRHVPLDETEQMVLDLLAESDDPLSIGELVLETDEKEHTMRKLMKNLVEQGKVKKMQAAHTGNGSGGQRFRLAIPVADSTGDGMDF
jgi:hypothetical protein